MKLDNWLGADGGFWELLWALPAYVITIAIVAWQYRKQIVMERKLFHTRIHSLLKQMVFSTAWGWGAGLTASLLMAFVGVRISWQVAVLLWLISFALLLVRIRFLCLAYAAGIIGILKFVVDLTPAWQNVPVLSAVADGLRDTSMVSIFILVGVLHLIEALLIRLTGTKFAVPLFLQGKRGKPVGAFHMSGFWPVPLFLISFTSNGESIWSVWTSGSFFRQRPWTFFLLPVVIGFMDIAVTRLPKEKAERISKWLLFYGVALIALALAADQIPGLLLLAALASVLLHEWLIWYGKWEEAQSSPLFVHDSRGLRILAVLPGSPADQMEIEAGEIIHKVNGKSVLSKEELHMALQINSACCKLEVINLQGHSKFVSRALYEGDHHQLGLLLAPDDDVRYVAGVRGTSFFRYLNLRRYFHKDDISKGA